jgi:hypothetical protein
MASKRIWQRILFAKWAVGVFLAVFAALWLLAEPFGVDPGGSTFENIQDL